MYKIIYGNAYVCNTESFPKSGFNEKVITSAALDFLETQEDEYLNDNGQLPDDWFDSIFWKRTERQSD